MGRSPYFVFLALPRAYQSDSPTRFGFIVSKKVSNKANKRNKIKRRLRELVRTELLAHHPETIAPFSAIVLIARQTALEASYQQLKDALLACLEKLHPQGLSRP